MDTPSHPMIEARDLSKYFGPFVAIENISFSIPVGQIVAFLGPNGAGKSTTMKILAGFMAPSQGIALIGGMDVHSDRIEASRKLGYLPENGPLYLDMTPLELLHFFGEARGIVGEELDRRIDWGRRPSLDTRGSGQTDQQVVERIPPASGARAGVDPRPGGPDYG